MMEEEKGRSLLDYDFKDPLGHPLKNCAAFRTVVDALKLAHGFVQDTGFSEDVATLDEALRLCGYEEEN